MKKEQSFFLFWGVVFAVFILFTINLDKLFPLPSPEETLQRLSSLQSTQHSKETHPGAPLVLEEYSDFQCPYCQSALPLLSKLQEEYGDKLNIVYKHSPLLQIHPYAGNAAEASECAAEQGKFWEYHDLLFANQGALDMTSLKVYAAQLNLDTLRFNQCLDGHEKAHLVEKDLNEAILKGVTGTPTFFINTTKILGADEAAIRYALDLALEEYEEGKDAI